ncbi:glucokinase [Thermomonospora echinospora]|uniref:Glucokinase n=1 Tax=Thermomonospora echinospora TaxID=1992 RepID=A0A1H6ACI3_9ACTN|nr:ROK family protein [Thermomonospora echinospora]SEG46010.1 glucokinase [Thermomonospora echinospora]
MSPVFALAVDIGGTKLAAALVEPGGRIAHYDRMQTPVDLDAEGLWRSLEALLDKLLAEAGGGDLAGVGVGCGGPMRWPSAEVSPLNIPAWRDFPLRERLRARHPGLPVRVHNDAICMAVGEHWRGAGRGRDNVLGMVVSTGVGGGLILGGHLIDGASGNAGHIGHVVVDPEGPPCKCGGRGCLEAVARGPGLVAWAQEQGWRPDRAEVTGVELADDARRGHPVATAAMRRAGRALGVAIASATHLCDLEVVSVGGGLSQAGPLLFDPLEEAFRAHARMDFAREVRVVPAALGQTAGLIGAAALVFAADRYWSAD